MNKKSDSEISVPQTNATGGYQVGQFAGSGTLRLSRNEGPCPLDSGDWCGTPEPRELLNRYPDLQPLTQAYADWLGISATRVVPTAGGDEGIERVIRWALQHNSRRILGHHPSFEMFEIYARNAGARWESVLWSGGDFPCAEYLRQLETPTALTVVVSPNNPTGATIATADMLKIASATQAAQVPLLVDLAYVEFADSDPTPDLMAMPHVFLIRTLSKAWGLAGLRVGFVIAPSPELAQELKGWGGPFTISNPSQALAQHALATQAEGLSARVELTRAIRNQLAALIAAAGGRPEVSQANFVLAEFPNAMALATALWQEGIAVRHYPAQSLLENSLRITCPADPRDLWRVATALGRVTNRDMSVFHDELLAWLNTLEDSASVAPIRQYSVANASAVSSNAGDVVSSQVSTRRSAVVTRETKETKIQAEVLLEGTGQASVATGIGFLDHMLTALSKHSGIDLRLECQGDLEVDDHHTSEDCAIVLGQCLRQALGERRGIRRFGFAFAPLDEALARVVWDFSGRPWCEAHLGLQREMLGTWATENISHFFQSLAQHAQASLHVDVIRGANDHHRVEAVFKAAAIALKLAIAVEGNEIPSTKGTL